MDKIRVLLVDDEPSFTRMLKLNLEKRGYTVVVENNGAYAYTVAQDFLPDFIFLDVIMPDVDGGELTARLKSDPQLGAIPIIFLTAIVSKEFVSRHDSIIGGRPFLAKPVDANELVRAVDQVLRKAA